VELGLAASRRHAQQLGDVLVSIALYVVKHKHSPRSRRKSRDRGLKVHSLADMIRRVRQHLQILD